jgi:hypothetical protein
MNVLYYLKMAVDDLFKGKLRMLLDLINQGTSNSEVSNVDTLSLFAMVVSCILQQEKPATGNQTQLYTDLL